MPQLRDPYLIPFDRTVVDETEIDFITEPWARPGEVRFIERVSARNEHRNETRVDIGLRHGGTNFWFRTLILTVHDQWYSFRFAVTALTAYRTILRFTGISLGDRLRANINGYILEPFEQPGVEAYRGG